MTELEQRINRNKLWNYKFKKCDFIFLGNAEMVSKLAGAASDAGKNNVAFLSHFILGDLEKCLDVLIESGRLPEAAFFARYVWFHIKY